MIVTLTAVAGLISLTIDSAVNISYTIVLYNVYCTPFIGIHGILTKCSFSDKNIVLIQNKQTKKSIEDYFYLYGIQ